MKYWIFQGTYILDIPEDLIPQETEMFYEMSMLHLITYIHIFV